jgi:hypothetical protein
VLWDAGDGISYLRSLVVGKVVAIKTSVSLAFRFGVCRSLRSNTYRRTVFTSNFHLSIHTYR